MSKYDITVGFTLTTTVEPDGHISGLEDEIDFSEESRFYGESVSVDGGQLGFQVEADSEVAAREMADNLMGRAYFSGDNLDWEIDGYDIMEIEEIIPPMDKDKAVTVLRDFINSAEGLTDEQREAFLFLLNLLCP